MVTRIPNWCHNVRVHDDAMTSSRGDFVAETLCQSLEPWPTITGSLHSVPVTSNWSVLVTVQDVSLHFNFVYTFNYQHTSVCYCLMIKVHPHCAGARGADRACQCDAHEYVYRTLLPFKRWRKKVRDDTPLDYT